MSTRNDDYAGDALAAILRELPVPALDAAVAERVRRLARAHLAPPPPAAPLALRFRLTLASSAVPALMTTAAAAHLGDLAEAAETAYGEPAAPKR